MKAKNHHLFTVGNAKTRKGEKLGYLTLILHLSPSAKNENGVDLCPWASEACRELCLVNSGRSEIFAMINQARERKSNEFLANRKAFVGKLIEEILYYQNRAKKKGLTAVVRLNGTSDIAWHKIKYKGDHILGHFPNIQFYDYTKSPFIMNMGAFAHNYHTTFSWSGENKESCLHELKQGFNVAVPFAGIKKTESLPKTFLGYKVIDGDKTDLRFLDKKNVIVGLRVKGSKQKKSESTFLVQIERKAS